MKTFIEISIEYINESTANRQLYNNIFINFRKNNKTVHVLS